MRACCPAHNSPRSLSLPGVVGMKRWLVAVAILVGGAASFSYADYVLIRAVLGGKAAGGMNQPGMLSGLPPGQPLPPGFPGQPPGGPRGPGRPGDPGSPRNPPG